MPALDGGDDFVGIGGPCEGFWGAWFVSVRKRLIAAWGSTTDRKTPRFNRRLESLAKKPSTALSHEQDVGVKCLSIAGCQRSQRRRTVCFDQRERCTRYPFVHKALLRGTAFQTPCWIQAGLVKSYPSQTTSPAFDFQPVYRSCRAQIGY